MSNIFDDKGHASQLALLALKTGTISETELMLLVEHIAECESCASVYADSFIVDELTKVPSGFAEEIDSKLCSKKEKNKQLAAYSFKVAIAVCATLVIIFSGVLNYATKINGDAVNLKSPDLTFVNTVNTELQDFSQKILNMEVIKNEKEKK